MYWEINYLFSGSYLELTIGKAILLSDVSAISMSNEELMLDVPPARMLPILGVLPLLFIVIEFVIIQEVFCKALRSSEKFRLESC